VEGSASVATCTENGKEADEECTRCHDVKTGAEIEALGHDMVTDAAKAATCTEKGLTEGSHCSRCDNATIKQEEIEALGHEMTEHVAKPATFTEEGSKTYWTCSHEKDVYYKDVNGIESFENFAETVIPKLIPSQLITDINTKTFVAGGDWTEFTFSTVANGHAGVMVYGGSDFGVKYEDKIAALEYKAGDQWIDMKGQNFGGTNGFPMTDATSTFRVKFTNDATGKYAFTASMKAVEGDEVLCSLNVPFEVKSSSSNMPPMPSMPDEKWSISNSGSASANNAVTSVDVTNLTTASTDGKTEVKIDTDLGNKIVQNAVDNKSTEIVIDATQKSEKSVTSVIVLPEIIIQEISDKTDAAVTIIQNNVSISLDKGAVAAVANKVGKTGTVKLTTEIIKSTESEVVVELKLETTNGYVTEFEGGNVQVTVNVNDLLKDKKLVCVFIDDNGTYSKVGGFLNTDGTYTFTTTHFSQYAIMEESEADAVIKAQIADYAKDLTVKARTIKTKKGNIKVTVSADVQYITSAGYTIDYKFYKSTKSNAEYKRVVTKNTNSCIFTSGKKGKTYYFKATLVVKDENGNTVYTTKLRQCKYGKRTK
ncbi:MAG: hypothetical protein ACI4LQ_06945, partial [Anaerovoracaceae bacterium]